MAEKQRVAMATTTPTKAQKHRGLNMPPSTTMVGTKDNKKAINKLQPRVKFSKCAPY